MRPKRKETDDFWDSDGSKVDQIALERCDDSNESEKSTSKYLKGNLDKNQTETPGKNQIEESILEKDLIPNEDSNLRHCNKTHEGKYFKDSSFENKSSVNNSKSSTSKSCNYTEDFESSENYDRSGDRDNYPDYYNDDELENYQYNDSADDSTQSIDNEIDYVYDSDMEIRNSEESWSENSKDMKKSDDQSILYENANLKDFGSEDNLLVSESKRSEGDFDNVDINREKENEEENVNFKHDTEIFHNNLSNSNDNLDKCDNFIGKEILRSALPNDKVYSLQSSKTSKEENSLPNTISSLEEVSRFEETQNEDEESNLESFITYYDQSKQNSLKTVSTLPNSNISEVASITTVSVNPKESLSSKPVASVEPRVYLQSVKDVPISESVSEQLENEQNFEQEKKAAEIKSEEKPNVKDERAGEPYQLLKFWLYRGRKMLEAGIDEACVDAFVRAYAFARIVHGDQHWRTARCKVFMARYYLEHAAYKQALSHSETAINVILSGLANSIALNEKPQVHHTLAWSYIVQGEARFYSYLVKSEAKFRTKNFNQAGNSLVRSMRYAIIYNKLMSGRRKLKTSQKLDEPAELFLRISKSQAMVYEKIHQFEKARSKLEDSFKYLKSLKDEEKKNVQMSDLLCRLGLLLLDHPGVTSVGLEKKLEKDYIEGLYCLEKSLDIIKTSQRPGSAQECDLRFLLTKYKLKTNQILKADQSMKTDQALRTGQSLKNGRNFSKEAACWELHKLKMWSERINGDSHEKTKNIRDLLIQILLQEEKYEEALTELNNILSSTRTSIGDHNSEVCQLLRMLSHVYAKMGNTAKSVIVLEEVLFTESILYGFSSRRVQTLKAKIKDLLMQLPQNWRNKLLKKFPDLKYRPPFQSYVKVKH